MLDIPVIILTLLFLVPLAWQDIKVRKVVVNGKEVVSDRYLDDFYLYGLVFWGVLATFWRTWFVWEPFFSTLGLAASIIICGIILEKLNIMGEGDAWIFAGIFLLNGATALGFTMIFAPLVLLGYQWITKESNNPFVPSILIGFILWVVYSGLLQVW